MTIPAPALLGERMWLEAQSSGAYATYEEFVDDCVPILRNEIELLLACPVRHTPPQPCRMAPPR